MISLQEVKTKALRKNAEKNNKLHFFASKLSIYFSWLFINMGLSANQVTVVFFLIGLAGSLCFLSHSALPAIIGYLLWRLHIIIDLCDGDVARYTQKFSINGAYWDYMIHSVLYPLAFVNICTASFLKYSNDLFLILGMFGGVVVSLLLAVKNNYYRAMLFNKIELDNSLGANSQEGIEYIVSSLLKNILSFDGFLFFYVLLVLLTENQYIYLSLFAFYVIVFIAVVLAKFTSFTIKGYYNRRS